MNSNLISRFMHFFLIFMLMFSININSYGQKKIVKRRATSSIVSKKKSNRNIDYSRYSKDLLTLAESGDMYAQHSIAECYEWGRNIDSNNDKFLYWAEKAAKQGHYHAQIDYLVARKWSENPLNSLNLAISYANGGNILVQSLLANYYENIGNGVQAFKWMYKAAFNTNVNNRNYNGEAEFDQYEAMKDLARYYEIGCAVNMEKSREIQRKADKMGEKWN